MCLGDGGRGGVACVDDGFVLGGWAKKENILAAVELIMPRWILNRKERKYYGKEAKIQIGLTTRKDTAKLFISKD